MNQIKEAEHDILSIQRVKVDPVKLERIKGGPSAVCPVCGEAYPAKHGYKCRNCNGESPYLEITSL